jgi:hypothetical protein
MLIVNCYEIMVLSVVYNCPLASWFLVLKYLLRYDRNCILSYNLYAMLFSCEVRYQTVRESVCYDN